MIIMSQKYQIILFRKAHLLSEELLDGSIRLLLAQRYQLSLKICLDLSGFFLFGAGVKEPSLEFTFRGRPQTLQLNHRVEQVSPGC